MFFKPKTVCRYLKNISKIVLVDSLRYALHDAVNGVGCGSAGGLWRHLI